MAVEIKELVIRAVVEYPKGKKTDKSAPDAGDVDLDALVQVCVRKVLKIINRSNKR